MTRTGHLTHEERRICEDAIERIYPDKMKTPRRILEHLLSGPKSSRELAQFMDDGPWNGGIELNTASKVGAEDRLLTRAVLKQNHDREGVDAQAFMTLCLARKELAIVRQITLPEYYLGPRGFADKYKFSIPQVKRGESYRLIVEDKPLEDAGGFWAAHLGNGKPTRILTGRPEFLQVNGDGMMFRQETLNGMSGDLAGLLRKELPVLAEMELDWVAVGISVA